MPGMIKRWLRRRLQLPRFDSVMHAEDENRQRGALVRKGRLVSLRSHVPANREAFQRWYADEEIARLLRHDLEPLTAAQSRSYFDTFILPTSARGTCWAIHERKSKRLVGTTALTDRMSGPNGRSALFRIVIGEKDCWGRGYGTEATRLVVDEAFDNLDLGEIRLEVFSHNERAIAAYRRVGFAVSGEHVEWVPAKQTELRVIEMRLTRQHYGGLDNRDLAADRRAGSLSQRTSEQRRKRQEERRAARLARRNDAAAPNPPVVQASWNADPEPSVDSRD
jgi:RimJ/RimL family protein N-acetyltransferase